MAIKRGTIRGCLLGLAVGDAMGYSIDGRSLEEIRKDYGPGGLMGYDLVNGVAEVSSYTQLAAFSANALLVYLTRSRTQGKGTPALSYIGAAVKEWSRSQYYCQQERNFCWLSAVPALKRRHCLDNRMLDILSKGNLGTPERPVSQYRHGGALTEVVPIALLSEELLLVDRLGAEAVALTHGDPEAFICGAALTHALSLLIRQPDIDVEELLRDTVDSIQMQYGREYPQVGKLWELLQMALVLVKAERVSPMEAMERLGCRTSAEILAGVLYACLTCNGDFDTAIITAVNHSGRSAAVGALTGAILGAIWGDQVLRGFYLDPLEPTDYLLELADDMFDGSPLDKVANLSSEAWERKYIHAKR